MWGKCWSHLTCAWSCNLNISKLMDWTHFGHMLDTFKNVTSIQPRTWSHLKTIMNVITEHIQVTFWGCNQYVPLWAEVWLHKPNTFKMCPMFYHWIHSGRIGGKHLKCAQLLTTGYIVVTWCQTFKMYPIFNRWAHCVCFAVNIQNVPNF